jgi:hypothetical protein
VSSEVIPITQRTRKVDMKIFVWVIATQSTLFSLGLGWAFMENDVANTRAAAAEAKVETCSAKIDAIVQRLNDGSSAVGRELTALQTDLVWIKQTLAGQPPRR